MRTGALPQVSGISPDCMIAAALEELAPGAIPRTRAPRERRMKPRPSEEMVRASRAIFTQ